MNVITQNARGIAAGQFGRIVEVYRHEGQDGGAGLFHADSGACFTVKAAEFTPCVSISREGYPVVAKGCGEDGSGNVTALPDGRYEVRSAYPIGCEVDPETGEDGAPITRQAYATREEAVVALRCIIGECGV